MDFSFPSFLVVPICTAACNALGKLAAPRQRAVTRSKNEHNRGTFCCWRQTPVAALPAATPWRQSLPAPRLDWSHGEGRELSTWHLLERQPARLSRRQSKLEQTIHHWLGTERAVGSRGMPAWPLRVEPAVWPSCQFSNDLSLWVERSPGCPPASAMARVKMGRLPATIRHLSSPPIL